GVKGAPARIALSIDLEIEAPPFAASGCRLPRFQLVPQHRRQTRPVAARLDLPRHSLPVARYQLRQEQALQVRRWTTQQQRQSGKTAVLRVDLDQHPQVGNEGVRLEGHERLRDLLSRGREG